MRRSLMLLSAIALLAGTSALPAQAQKLDANGRCHAANGQFAKAEVCGGAARSMAPKAGKPSGLAPAEAAPATRLKVPERCKNDKGRFAKCGSPGSHPA